MATHPQVAALANLPALPASRGTLKGEGTIKGPRAPSTSTSSIADLPSRKAGPTPAAGSRGESADVPDVILFPAVPPGVQSRLSVRNPPTQEDPLMHSGESDKKSGPSTTTESKGAQMGSREAVYLSDGPVIPSPRSRTASIKLRLFPGSIGKATKADPLASGLTPDMDADPPGHSLTDKERQGSVSKVQTSATLSARASVQEEGRSEAQAEPALAQSRSTASLTSRPLRSALGSLFKRLSTKSKTRSQADALQPGSQSALSQELVMTPQGEAGESPAMQKQDQVPDSDKPLATGPPDVGRSRRWEGAAQFGTGTGVPPSASGDSASNLRAKSNSVISKNGSSLRSSTLPPSKHLPEEDVVGAHRSRTDTGKGQREAQPQSQSTVPAGSGSSFITGPAQGRQEEQQEVSQPEAQAGTSAPILSPALLAAVSPPVTSSSEAVPALTILKGNKKKNKKKNPALDAIRAEIEAELQKSHKRAHESAGSLECVQTRDNAAALVAPGAKRGAVPVVEAPNAPAATSVPVTYAPQKTAAASAASLVAPSAASSAPASREAGKSQDALGGKSAPKAEEKGKAPSVAQLAKSASQLALQDATIAKNPAKAESAHAMASNSGLVQPPVAVPDANSVALPSPEAMAPAAMKSAASTPKPKRSWFNLLAPSKSRSLRNSGILAMESAAPAPRPAQDPVAPATPSDVPAVATTTRTSTSTSPLTADIKAKESTDKFFADDFEPMEATASVAAPAPKPAAQEAAYLDDEDFETEPATKADLSPKSTDYEDEDFEPLSIKAAPAPGGKVASERKQPAKAKAPATKQMTPASSPAPEPGSASKEKPKPRVKSRNPSTSPPIKAQGGRKADAGKAGPLASTGLTTVPSTTGEDARSQTATPADAKKLAELKQTKQAPRPASQATPTRPHHKERAHVAILSASPLVTPKPKTAAPAAAAKPKPKLPVLMAVDTKPKNISDHVVASPLSEAELPPPVDAPVSRPVIRSVVRPSPRPRSARSMTSTPITGSTLKVYEAEFLRLQAELDEYRSHEAPFEGNRTREAIRKRIGISRTIKHYQLSIGRMRHLIRCYRFGKNSVFDPVLDTRYYPKLARSESQDVPFHLVPGVIGSYVSQGRDYFELNPPDYLDTDTSPRPTSVLSMRARTATNAAAHSSPPTVAILSRVSTHAPLPEDPLQLGERCSVVVDGDRVIGTVRFRGPVVPAVATGSEDQARRPGVPATVGATSGRDNAGDACLWLGIELDRPLGCHDGLVKGHRYFHCKPYHGLLIKDYKVARL